MRHWVRLFTWEEMGEESLCDKATGRISRTCYSCLEFEGDCVERRLCTIVNKG